MLKICSSCLMLASSLIKSTSSVIAAPTFSDFMITTSRPSWILMPSRVKSTVSIESSQNLLATTVPMIEVSMIGMMIW